MSLCRRHRHLASVVSAPCRFASQVMVKFIGQPASLRVIPPPAAHPTSIDSIAPTSPHRAP